jgi:hypothetical protein
MFRKKKNLNNIQKLIISTIIHFLKFFFISMLDSRVKHEDQYFIANGIDVSSYTQNVEWFE